MAKLSPTLPPTPRAQRWIFTLVYILLSAVGLYGLQFSPNTKSVDKHMQELMKGGEWRFPGQDTILRRHYTGIGPVDFGASFLVAAFFHGAAGWTKGIQLQQGYFLLQFFAVLTAWSVESVRTKNGWAVITFTSLWALFYQTVGGAVIIPLYYLCYTWMSARPEYWAAGRELPLAKARTLLPAVVLGYLVPTLATWLPLDLFDLETRQGMVALWQISPLIVNVLWLLFSSIYGAMQTDEKPRPSADSRAVSILYLLAFVVTQSSHAVVLFLCSTSTDPSLSFDFLFNLRQPTQPLMHDGIHFIFKVDYWIIFIATIIWCVQAEWEIIALRRTSLNALTAVLITVLGSVILGPGAVCAAVWWWREFRIGAVPVAKKKA